MLRFCRPGNTALIDLKAVAGKVDWLAGNRHTCPLNNHFVALLSHEGKFSHLSQVPSVWILHGAFSSSFV